MALSLASISKGQVLRAPRMVVLGVEKLGKTTFACGSHFDGGQLVQTGMNYPIVIPVKGEEGTDALEVPVFPTCNSFDEILEALGVLAQDEHEFKTVVLDSASAMEPLVFDKICKEHNESSIEKVLNGYGKGYTLALDRWRQITETLDYLRTEKNMASIIIGHVKVKRFDDPGGDSYDQYQFDINEKAANLLFRWADVILFCNTKVAVKKEKTGFGNEKKIGVDNSNNGMGGGRFLFTQKRPAHPGGGRGLYGQLPYELPLDWVAFQDAIAEAASRQIGQ
jgi:hypothetical protein